MSLRDEIDKHRQQHDPATGGSFCSCGEWTGPFTQYAKTGLRFSDHLIDVGIAFLDKAMGTADISPVHREAFAMGFAVGQDRANEEWRARVAHLNIDELGV